MRRSIYPIAAVSLTVALSQSAISSELEALTHGGSQSPHVHGNAELHMVLDASQLFLELHSPAMNLLGFEHTASSPEQQAIIESTRIKLANTHTYFMINGGECTLNQQSTDFPAVLNVRKSVQADDDRHDNKKNTHRHHDEGDESNNESHSDIESIYRYTCAKPDKLRSMIIRLYEVFPSIESLQVQWVMRNQQGATMLNDDNHEIHFR